MVPVAKNHVPEYESSVRFGIDLGFVTSHTCTYHQSYVWYHGNVYFLPMDRYHAIMKELATQLMY